MQKILILGAGIYQVPLIKAAKDMGLKTIVVSVEGPYPGIELADEFFPINTTDVSAVTKLAVDQSVDAVITTGTDVSVPALGAVVDQLGLPGTGYEAALTSMNKVRMKKALYAAGVKTAEFQIVYSEKEALAAASEIGLPVMVKAVDSSGSRGITRVTSLALLPDAWEQAKANTRSDAVLVEKWLDGVEFGAQAFVQGSRVVRVLSHNDTVTPPPNCTPIGHSVPVQFCDEQIKSVEETVIKAIKALGIRDTVSNVDLMLVGDVPYVIELGARMGATCLPENICHYIGGDIYEYLINTALGNQPEIPNGYSTANAALLLFSCTAGELQEVIVPEEIELHKDVLELVIDVKPGEKVDAFKVGPDRLGHIIVAAESAELAEAKAIKLAAKIQFKLR